jgi:hypothetical protein
MLQYWHRSQASVRKCAVCSSEFEGTFPNTPRAHHHQWLGVSEKGYMLRGAECWYGRLYQIAGPVGKPEFDEIPENSGSIIRMLGWPSWACFD